MVSQFEILDYLKENRTKEFKILELMGIFGSGRDSMSKKLSKLSQYGFVETVIRDTTHYVKYKEAEKKW